MHSPQQPPPSRAHKTSASPALHTPRTQRRSHSAPGFFSPSPPLPADRGRGGDGEKRALRDHQAGSRSGRFRPLSWAGAGRTAAPGGTSRRELRRRAAAVSHPKISVDEPRHHKTMAGRHSGWTSPGPSARASHPRAGPKDACKSEGREQDQGARAAAARALRAARAVAAPSNEAGARWARREGPARGIPGRARAAGESSSAVAVLSAAAAAARRTAPLTGPSAASSRLALGAGREDASARLKVISSWTGRPLRETGVPPFRGRSRHWLHMLAGA
ncbi:hypothetical protein PtB15_3B237 [Puccinia triticina]|nr:hypothetical protein PtB15_3B237 [Puccinia triticina]